MAQRFVAPGQRGGGQRLTHGGGVLLDVHAGHEVEQAVTDLFQGLGLVNQVADLINPGFGKRAEILFQALRLLGGRIGFLPGGRQRCGQGGDVAGRAGHGWCVNQ